MAHLSIIGTGNMARGLAARAIAGGNSVQILAHGDKAKADALAAEFTGQVSTGVLGDAVTGSIVIPEKELSLLKPLRNQALLAIKQAV